MHEINSVFKQINSMCLFQHLRNKMADGADCSH